MKPTQEQLDQLVSGYIDGVLDDEESHQFQGLLKSDPSIADQLKKAVEIRESVKLAFQVAPTVRPPEGFATEILSAAVARAHEEGMELSHPLMRVQQEPFNRLSKSSTQVSTRRLLVFTAAIAASLLAFVFGTDFLDQESKPGSPLLAQIESPSVNEKSISELTQSDSGEKQGSIDGISESNISVAQSAANVTDAEGEQGSANDGRTDLQRAVDSTASQQQGPMIASSSAVVDRTMEEANDGNSLEALQSPTGAVLVLELKQSEAGRESQAVRNALALAGIRSASEIPVKKNLLEDLIQQSDSRQELTQAENPRASEASVLFLRVSAKSFDQFYQLVWSDQQGVESLAMSIALDAPLLSLVESVRRDPTTVQDQAVSFQFEEERAQSLLLDRLQKLPLVPMDREVRLTPSLGSEADLQTQVFLLVR